MVVCQMGRNRSGAVLLGHLFVHRGMGTLEEASSLIVELRQLKPDALNNFGLIKCALEAVGLPVSLAWARAQVPESIPQRMMTRAQEAKFWHACAQV